MRHLGLAQIEKEAERCEAQFATALGVAVDSAEALVERRLLFAWAEATGARCPRETETALASRVLANHGWSSPPEGLREWAREKATVEWMLHAGPKYFGLSWSLELATLNDLQLERLEEGR